MIRTTIMEMVAGEALQGAGERPPVQHRELRPQQVVGELLERLGLARDTAVALQD